MNAKLNILMEWNKIDKMHVGVYILKIKLMKEKMITKRKNR